MATSLPAMVCKPWKTVPRVATRQVVDYRRGRTRVRTTTTNSNLLLEPVLATESVGVHGEQMYG